MTLAHELHLLANEISDAERELQELKHDVFTLKTENDQLRKSLESRISGDRTPSG